MHMIMPAVLLSFSEGTAITLPGCTEKGVGVVGVQCSPWECSRLRCCLRMHAPTTGMWCTITLSH